MSSPLFARVVLGALCLVYASRTAAQPGPGRSIDGKVQLQLQTSVVEYSRQTNESDADSGAPKTETRGVQLGVASRLGLALGYGVSNRLQLHRLTGFVVQHLEAEVDGSDMPSTRRQSGFEIMPSLRYVATENSATRLLLGFGIGATGVRSNDDGSGLDIASKALQVGGMIGAYRFVTPHFSVDPGFELYYTKTSTSVDDGLDERTVSGSGVRVLLTVGLSGWFGGQAQEQCESDAATGSPSYATAEVVQPLRLEALIFRAHLG